MTVWGIMSGESLPITFERDDETGAEGRRPHPQQRGKAGYGHGWSSLAVSTQAHTPQSIWPQALPPSHTQCLRLGELALPSNPSWGPVVQRPLYTLSCRVWASCPYNLLLLFPPIILCAFLSPCDHVSKEPFFFFWDFFFKWTLHPTWGSNSQSRDEELHALLIQAAGAPLQNLIICVPPQHRVCI